MIARFTLDAMQANKWRLMRTLTPESLIRSLRSSRSEHPESDFYGSMDGASKFVRGDAIAGILILVINIVGGLIVGTTQRPDLGPQVGSMCC